MHSTSDSTPKVLAQSSLETTRLLDDAELIGTGHTPIEQDVKYRRQIGVFSAVFIIFNRIIGTGIFATSSTILFMSGSVGLSLVIWIIGAVIAVAGVQVYIAWGTALPHNGGEKNYLEYLFPNSKKLIISMYASFVCVSAWAAANSLVFAEYILIALVPSHVTPYLIRLVAFCCITFAFLVHGLYVKLGLRLQNTLGMLKIAVLLGVICTGLVAHLGYFHPDVDMETPNNWENIWDGTRWGTSELCVALYNIMWSYVGFSNVNYALSEVHNPARTLRLAGPIALGVVTLLYLLTNAAYFSGVSKGDITGSGRLVAALLVRNVWGPSGERLFGVAVALSTIGNVMSVSFSQGRVNQELGKEGILPWSNFWASDWPRHAPLTGLGLHWAVCSVVIFGVPSGDAYNFVINVISYPLSVVNATISIGLIYLLLHSSSSSLFSSSPSKIALLIPTTIFALSNIFLFVAPLAPPPADAEPYETLPYWTHAVAGWGAFGLGALWWWVRRERGSWKSDE